MSKSKEFNDKIHKATELLHEVSKEWDETLLENYPKELLSFDEVISALECVKFKEKQEPELTYEQRLIFRIMKINELFNNVMKTMSLVGVALNNANGLFVGDELMFSENGQEYALETNEDMLNYIYEQTSYLLMNNSIDFSLFTVREINGMIDSGQCSEKDVVEFYRNEQWRDIV